MKFSIKKNIILDQLINVSKAISPKNIIPILNGIKFSLTDEGLKLVASNSDLTIESFISKDNIESIEATGEIIVQSKFILDIIKNMPTDIINFEVFDGLKIMIYSEKTQFNLNCLNSLDYPTIDIVDAKNHIDIKSSELKKLIKQTIFAISTQESRPLLTGLNIKINGDVLECVATDSYRLAKKVIKLDTPYDEAVDIVIPGRNINEFDHIISDDDKNVEIHIVNNKLLFKYENILFLSNLLNGTYPNTSSFIPSEFKHLITAKLSDYFASIDRAALLASSKEKNIIKMEAKEDELCISSFSDEIGKVEDYIKVARNNNEDISISFSSKYMSDALKTIDAEDIVIKMNEDSKPIIIQAIDDDSLTQLILPIKTY
jgi:DNA polymerase-3 subunit beta